MAFQDFDQIQERVQLRKQINFKKRITIIVSVVVVILLLVGAGIGIYFYMKNKTENSKKSTPAPAPPKSTPTPAQSAAATADAPKKEIKTSGKAVKNLCAGTDYQKICESSLTKAVGENPSPQPKDLLKASFSVTSEEIDKAVKEVGNLKYDDPLKKAALEDCLLLLADATEELNSSISTVQVSDMAAMSSRRPDIDNWLSAVMSYQQTCVDGFPDGTEKDEMQKLLKNANELGSNALAVVSQSSSLISMVKGAGGDAGRKLYRAGFPEWMSRENRRMLRGNVAAQYTPNITVAKDGSGNFSSINEALKAMPKKYEGRYIIYVKEGIYEENVVINKTMVNVTMYGDGSQKSVVTGNKNYVDGVSTFQTATFAALGEGFMCQSMGFRNTAGPEKHQAVALRVQSDRSIFINCRMEGYQDTLYAQTHRQFYRSCYITGTVDFIFGDAAAVFQNCMIYVRKPMENQQNIVTAQGRVDKRETTGIVIQNSHILADDKLEPEKSKFKTYLGRPWKEFSRTVIMETQIGDLLQPEGWMEWSGDFALKTLYYAEFNNKGAGANTDGRVKWEGYHKSIEREQAMNFTVGPFLQGEEWLKVENVTVKFGLYT